MVELLLIRMWLAAITFPPPLHQNSPLRYPIKVTVPVADKVSVASIDKNGHSIIQEGHELVLHVLSRVRREKIQDNKCISEDYITETVAGLRGRAKRKKRVWFEKKGLAILTKEIWRIEAMKDTEDISG